MESSPSPSSSSSSSSAGVNNSNNSTVNWHGMNFPFRSPLSFVMDYWTRDRGDSAEPVIMIPHTRYRFRVQSDATAASGSGGGGDGEVAIRIGGEQENSASSRNRIGELSCNEVMTGRGVTLSEEARLAIAADVVGGGSGSGGGDGGGRGRDSSSNYPRFDFQQIAKWVEQILPFSLLLLVVLIRQHLQGLLFLFFF